MIKSNIRPAAFVVVAILALGGAMPASSASYELDTSHSQIQFKVRHLGISSVIGHFSVFGGTLDFDPEAMDKGSVNVVIDAASIDTAEEKRDEHLRSGDFLNVAEFPELRFESTSVKSTADGLEVSGNLTIRDVTRPVVLEAEFNGQAKDPWGNSRVGFEASTTINRTDFGLTWNKMLEAGGVLVGEDVRISLTVQAIEQAVEAAPAS